MRYVLDASIVDDVAIKGRNERAYDRARSAIARAQFIRLSAVAYFECLRGILTAAHPKHLKDFEAFAHDCGILPFDDRAALAASRVWAWFERQHEPPRGSFGQDIMTAAIAVVHNAAVVTKDVDDFQRIRDACDAIIAAGIEDHDFRPLILESW